MMPAPTSTTSVLASCGSDTRIDGPFRKWTSSVLAWRFQVIPATSTRVGPGQPGSAAKVSSVTAWEPDVLAGYWQQTFVLGPDPDGEGDLVATLVRRGEPEAAATRAVLMVHGFTDYFFHTELADHFAARGFIVYALDLHKCGRSWREGQTPHFTTDLARYDTELERAVDLIRAECNVDGRQAPQSPANILLYGHSAGGLIVSLWLDRLRSRGMTQPKDITGLVLNSPWLDLQGPAILRTAPTAAALAALSRVRKRMVVRPPPPRVATARHCTATTAATSITT